jgi:DNA-binding GntR family transcriptional regulator
MQPLPSRDMGRHTVRRSVAEYLKELMFEGKLAQGDHVPQDEVAAALHVSNTPVREALIALEHEGLVRIEPHRGAFVNGIDAESIRIQYELFAVIWEWAVRRATVNASSDAAEALLAVGRSATRIEDAAETYTAMTTVADMLQVMSGSREWRRLLDRLPRLVPGSAFYRIPGALAAAADGLEPMAVALQQRRVELAVAYGRDMMRSHGEALLQELEHRRVIARPVSNLEVRRSS